MPLSLLGKSSLIMLRVRVPYRHLVNYEGSDAAKILWWLWTVIGAWECQGFLLYILLL
ncbi:hypothetical protein SAICODRAFT_104922 [Saitoella complicata NRRL Y-17804]|uniref:uncharacterized protein n=1 Tax=Saitoella complicata (strain BCRC 22490 / CBS 7301 / JCM 7358 / NBRC 10748 / NRRL Y-17804) TaxID=698492 RepID=UPI000867CC24|nr:uncharacterized protein SAICODRAFT_104922 [Saitoella complicata NRRL Y-17804]ODQ56230.1 hypothetical protein SAICODRAFT_104922 [Saitoella complicata NRRL Y-17804]